MSRTQSPRTQSPQAKVEDSARRLSNVVTAKDNSTSSKVKNAEMRPLQLLAPARDADTAIVAIDHGADAVYMGAPSHGARAAAANSIEDIHRACQYAHRYAACVYVTVNTIIYDDELDDVRRMVWDLYHAGVDALIVQDMSLLRMDLPPIALHASTQCDIRTPQKARFLARAGFGQIVLPRELSLDDIRRYAEEVPRGTSLEAFVHGALCVCYSGDCRASLVAGGRSANRRCPCTWATPVVAARLKPHGRPRCHGRCRHLIVQNRGATQERILRGQCDGRLFTGLRRCYSFFMWPLSSRFGRNFSADF